MPLIAAPFVAAVADENPDVATLTQPASSIEAGARDVSSGSAKFGEYNGLNKSGVDAIANFDLRGGDAYKAYEGGNGTNRWEIRGTELGTTSRAASGTASDQGRWNIDVSFDQLRHYSTDSYQTPFQGRMGGNTFLLPGSFGVIDATDGGPAGTGTQGLAANQLVSFHREDIYSERQNKSLRAGYLFNSQWSAQFDYNRLDQSGAKLTGVSFSPDASGAGAGEKVGVLMNPTRYATDTFEFALNWAGAKGYARAGYFGSLFKDEYSSVSFSNPFVDTSPGPSTTGAPPDGGAFPVDTYATAPNNQFHQLDLSGGYVFAPGTTLTGGVSYGRNTQTSAFISDPLFTSVLPSASLDGLVVSTHADIKLINQTTRKLSLSAGVKFNERDNRTPSQTFGSFLSIAGDPWGSVVNAPVSNKRTQYEAAANYRFDRRQSLRVTYEHETIRRWCDNALANNAQSSDPAAPAGFYTGSGCVEVAATHDDKVSAAYRLKIVESVRFNAAYSYSNRKADFNSSYYNPMQTSGEGFQNFGFVPYFDASRTENLIKAGVDWQAAEKWDVTLNGRYVNDKYGSSLGVQSSHMWSANLDSTWGYAENGSVSAYVSVQRRQRDLLSGLEQSPLAPPPSLWNNRLADDNNTVGLTARRKGLLRSRLELLGDLSFSSGKSSYSTSLVNYTDVLCTNYSITCGNLPAIKNDTLRLRLAAAYQLNKAGVVSLHYTYQKLNSNDYFYSGYQVGYTDVTVLPTNQMAPSYSVNVVGISYVARLK
jgi:MtrB/PioB family decaheme-associated outer membrane protein